MVDSLICERRFHFLLIYFLNYVRKYGLLLVLGFRLYTLLLMYNSIRKSVKTEELIKKCSPVLTWRSEPAKSTKCKWPARMRCFPSFIVVLKTVSIFLNRNSQKNTRLGGSEKQRRFSKRKNFDESGSFWGNGTKKILSRNFPSNSPWIFFF